MSLKSIITIAMIGLFCPTWGNTAIAKPVPPQKNANKQIVHHKSQTMGTVVDITIWTDNEEVAAQASIAAFAEFKRVNGIMSSWLPDSDVATINREAGHKAVVVDKEVLKLALRAQKAARQSKGAFDISVGAFRGLWKFDEDIDGTIPDEDDVQKRAQLVNYKKIRIQKNKKTIRLMSKGMRITLGGVAKGYALDRSVAILRAQGFNDFIIQAGGDLYASGKRGDRAWRVGIRDPRGNREASFALAEIQNQTFSTSGDYERSLVIDGKRYHHILDPKTGHPASRSRSVTVLAPDALTADIWSTALFVMGPKAGMKYVESRTDMDAVFVSADNQVTISSGLKDKVKILKPPSAGI